MSEYYDREGKPITLLEWANLFEDAEYKTVASTTIGEVRVSTVWLGMDHSLAHTPYVIIFESMIFGGDMNEYCQRYSTEDQALSGHIELVKEVQESQAIAEEFARIEEMEVDKAVDQIKRKYTGV